MSKCRYGISISFIDNLPVAGAARFGAAFVEISVFLHLYRCGAPAPGKTLTDGFAYVELALADRVESPTRHRHPPLLFSPSKEFPWGDVNPQAVKVIDVDGDGKPDVVTVHNLRDELSVLLYR